jgi:hypothetical protein
MVIRSSKKKVVDLQKKSSLFSSQNRKGSIRFADTVKLRYPFAAFACLIESRPHNRIIMPSVERVFPEVKVKSEKRKKKKHHSEKENNVESPVLKESSDKVKKEKTSQKKEVNSSSNSVSGTQPVTEDIECGYKGNRYISS